MRTRVLIIEDNVQNMYMLSYLLESENYEVLQASNGALGIKRALQEKPDVILLDIQLPKMDGYQVAAKLREHEELNDIPVIAVTSYAMPGDKEKALESGSTGYIEKPINPDTFIKQMESFLPVHLIPKSKG